MKNDQPTAPTNSAANSAKNDSANTSNSDCASFPLSNAERAAIRNRVEALLERFMERRTGFGAGGAYDAEPRPSLLTVDRPGLMDAEAGAKTRLSGNSERGENRIITASPKDYSEQISRGCAERPASR